MSITVTEKAVARICQQRETTGHGDLHLRLTVEGGGCSGYQYILGWDRNIGQDDILVDAVLVTDVVSL